MPYCKNCGAEVPLKAMFCRNCGTPTVHNKPTAPQSTPAGPIEPQPTPQPVPTPQAVPAPQPIPQPEPEPTPLPESQSEPATQPEPQSEPAPQVEPESAPATQPEPQPTKKKGKVLLFILIPLAVVLLAGISGAMWFFVYDKEDELKAEIAEAELADDAQQPVATEQVAVSEATPVAEPEPVVEEPVLEPMKGTEQSPTDADFSSWYIGKAQTKGMPRGVVTLTTLDDVQGGWKALFFQDPKNKYGVKAYTLANIIIAGSASELTFTIKRHNTRFLTTNECIDEEKELDDVFNARWDNGKLNASGAGSLTITSFWEQDGKQYAIGTFDSPDGIPVSLGMVRP